MNIHSEYENKIGYIYGSLLLIILVIVTIFLLCDFNALPEGWCRDVNQAVNSIVKTWNHVIK